MDCFSDLCRLGGIQRVFTAIVLQVLMDTGYGELGGLLRVD